MTIMWCVPVVHRLFYLPSRTLLAATSVRMGCHVHNEISILVLSGRQFYKCSKRDGGCDFFLWADSPSNGGGASSTTMSSSSYHGRDSSHSYNRLVTLRVHSVYVYDHIIHRSTATGYGSDPNCKCGSKAVKYTSCYAEIRREKFNNISIGEQFKRMDPIKGNSSTPVPNPGKTSVDFFSGQKTVMTLMTLLVYILITVGEPQDTYRQLKNHEI